MNYAKQTIHFVLTALTCALVFASGAHAQEVTRMPTRHAITLDGGLQSAVRMRVGYSQRVDWLGDDSRLYGRFALPVAAPDFGDFAFDAGARMHVLGQDGWGLQALAGPSVRHGENRLAAMTGLGLHASLLSGYQTQTWGLLLDIGIEQMLTTYIQQSSLYRSTFYAEAKSGWYALTAGTMHAGLRGGGRLGQVELSLSAGVTTDLQLQPGLPPFYLLIGSAYSF